MTKLLTLGLLLLSCGVAEAGGIPTDCGSNGRQDCVMYGDPILGLVVKPVEKQKKLVRAEGRSVNEQARAAYGVSAAPSPTKQVIIPEDDFIVMLSKVEHTEKLKHKALAENGVLLKLKDEQGTIIKIQAEQIQACEKIVQQQEQLGATQEQLSQAVEMELRKVQKELEREKRLSRYKSEFVALAGAILFRRLWVMQ